MLYLLEKDGSSFYLLCGQTYTIGRKNTDIIIENDVSISRHHATITIGLSSAVIIDNGSKYKIQKNGVEIASNVETRIQDGDVIKFGRLKSIYNFKRVIIITTASGLDKSEKQTLKTNIENLGGKLYSEWSSNCTHLTVNGIALTVKYLHCLIDKKPTVTVDYWTAILASAKKKLPAPNIEKFKPPITETLLIGQDFNFGLDRTSLFNGKVFIFSDNKIYSKMNDIIVKCGGQSLLWNNQLKIQDIIKNLNRYLFIQCDNNEDFPESLKIIHDEIKKLNQRLIPLSEIAFAIFYCSCEKNCNPNSNVIKSIFQTKMEIVEHIPVVNETQSQQDQITHIKDEYEIPASFDIPLTNLLPTTQQNNSRNIDGAGESSVSDQKKRKAEHLSENVKNDSGIESNNVGDSSNNSGNFKKARIENPFSLNKIVTTSDVNDKKRKADDNLSNPKAKQSLVENPFTRLRNQVIDKIQPVSDNPFVNVRIKNESTIETINSNQTTINRNVIETPPSTLTTTTQNLNVSNSSRFSTSGWIKKDRSSQSSTTSTVKIEDEDMQMIFEKFKNTVTTGVMPELLRSNLDEIMSQTNRVSNGVNFKRFKKVAPLQPKDAILNATVNRSMGAIQSVSVEHVSDNEDEELKEEEVPICLPTIKANFSKKFNF